MTKAKSTTRHLAIVLGLALLISLLQGLPAQAVEATVNCSTSGTFTITDGVQVTSHNLCTGTALIPEGVVTIYDDAFVGATGLTSVLLPTTLTLVGARAFSDTPELKSITIPNSVVEIQSSAFQFSGLTSITIPAGVVSIGNYAFSGANALATVTFGENSGLTSIGTYAFRNATGLTSINIPASVTGIGANAFDGATALATVAFGESSGLTSIGNFAFRNTSALTSIVIPSGVTTLGDYAFSGATRLASVSLPESLPLIRQFSFAGATALTSINIPASVTGIGANAFDGANALATVTFGESSGLTSIGNNAFQNATALRTINIPPTLSSLGTSAFWNATSLTALTIPAAVTSIGSNTFRSATSLASITFGPGSQLTSIGSTAFSGATALASIALPSGVTAINAFAFSGASNLATVLIAGNAPTLGLSAFSGVHPGALAQITSVATGFGADGSTWDRLTVDLVKVTCLGGGSLTVTKKVVSANSSCVGSVDLPATITGVNDGSIAGASGIASISVAANNPNFVAENGVLFNADKTTLVAYPAASANVTYAVPAEVTTIAAGAFAGASNLASLTFAGDAPTVGSNAFTGLAAGATANIASSAVGFGDASLWNSLTLIRPSVPVDEAPVVPEPTVGVTDVPASAPIYVVTPPAVVVTPPAVVEPHALESVAPIFPRFSVQLAKSSKLLIGVDSRRSSATIARNSQGFIMNATISEASRPFCTITKARRIIGGVVRVSGFKVTAKNAKTGICQVTLYAAASPTHKASQKTFAVRVSAKG